MAQVLEVLVEVWQEELLQPGTTIHIKGLGKLRIDEQEITTNAAVKRLLAAYEKEAPETLKRYYFLFYPSDQFKQQVIEFRKVMEENPHE